MSDNEKPAPVNALVKVHTTLDRHAFEPRNGAQLAQMARELKESGLLPKAIHRWEQAAAIVHCGRSYGLNTWQSIRGLRIVEGKVEMAAEMMHALCQSAIDVCEFFEVVECGPEFARWTAKRRNRPAKTVEYTIDEARQAGLIKTVGKNEVPNTWMKHPTDMLNARCKARLARLVFPDIVGGVYIPDEIQEIKQLNATVTPSRIPDGTPVDDPGPPVSEPTPLRKRLDAALSALAEACVDGMPEAKKIARALVGDIRNKTTEEVTQAIELIEHEARERAASDVPWEAVEENPAPDGETTKPPGADETTGAQDQEPPPRPSTPPPRKTDLVCNKCGFSAPPHAKGGDPCNAGPECPRGRYQPAKRRPDWAQPASDGGVTQAEPPPTQTPRIKPGDFEGRVAAMQQLDRERRGEPEPHPSEPESAPEPPANSAADLGFGPETAAGARDVEARPGGLPAYVGGVDIPEQVDRALADMQNPPADRVRISQAVAFALENDGRVLIDIAKHDRDPKAAERELAAWSVATVEGRPVFMVRPMKNSAGRLLGYRLQLDAGFDGFPNNPRERVAFE